MEFNYIIELNTRINYKFCPYLKLGFDLGYNHEDQREAKAAADLKNADKEGAQQRAIKLVEHARKPAVKICYRWASLEMSARLLGRHWEICNCWLPASLAGITEVIMGK